jgi:hypothetical protein
MTIGSAIAIVISLGGPDVSQPSVRTLVLDAGMNELSRDIPADPATCGTGTYQLTGVLMTSVDDVASWALGHDASLQIADETQMDDVGGLVADWRVRLLEQANAVLEQVSP